MGTEQSTSRALLALAVVAFAGSVALRVVLLDPSSAKSREQRLDEDALRSPGPDVLALATFEHRLAFADVMWLAIVQELGKGFNATSGGWDRVERWADIATDLDPKYFNPYHTVGIHLALYGKRLESSNRILHKGWQAIPNEWQFPFVLAYNAYFIGGHPQIASDYMAEAAKLPGVPRYVPALAGRMRFHAGDVGGAMDYLETIIPFLEGPARSDAEERLAILQTEPRMKMYDEACKRFLDENGRPPVSGEELRQWAQLDEPAKDELGYPIELDKDCIARTEMIKVREFEAMKRLGSEARGEGLELPMPTEPRD